MVLVGTNIDVPPDPGFVKYSVNPIPTPLVVPNPTDSMGLKYNSLLSKKVTPRPAEL